MDFLVPLDKAEEYEKEIRELVKDFLAEKEEQGG